MNPIMFIYWCVLAVLIVLKIVGVVTFSFWWLVAMAVFPFALWLFIVVGILVLVAIGHRSHPW